MPAPPPETPFYDDNDNAELWRDESRLFENFVGGEPQRIERFITVVEDILVRLREARTTPDSKTW